MLALCLTLMRIALGPLFLFIYVHHAAWGIEGVFVPCVLLGLIGVSELSDLLDGFVARRYNQVTDLGRILDPMADSIFRLTVFFTFTQGVVQLPLMLVLAFLYRDSMISTLRTLCALRGVALGARLSGKIKAIVQALGAVGVLFMMIPYSLGFMDLELFRSLSLYLITGVCVYTLGSGVEYVVANRKYIRQALVK